jgi:4-hydroxybenzoate polyprenyltransferase
VLFIIASALPYLYASYLKEIPVVGTILISALISLSIVIVGVFELIPAITIENRSVQSTMFEVLCDYALFVFLIHFIREFTKDIISINGDHKVGLKTLPIMLGKQRTSKIAFGLTLLTSIGVVLYVSSYLYMHTYAILYFLIAVVGPLLYVAIRLFMAETNQQFLHCINILKVIILTGVLSMLLYRFIF